MKDTIALYDLIKLVRYGDILLVRNPNILGTVIKWFQELQGDEAIYTHAAIISDSPPHIYEAAETLKEETLHKYIDYDICLIRHNLMTFDRYEKAVINVIRPHLGDIYPFHRLILHAVDNSVNWILRKIGVKCRLKTAKWVSYNMAVCSEWVDMFYHDIGLVDEWRGHNPDDIHDRALAHPENWRIIYEGKLI